MNELAMLDHYKKITDERKEKGLPPLPLNAKQVHDLIEGLKKSGPNDALLLELLKQQVPPGVDEAAYVKAAFLSDVANSKVTCSAILPIDAIEILGTMRGGYNVQALVALLTAQDSLAQKAGAMLADVVLVYDYFNDVVKLHESGNKHATVLLHAWADGQWFLKRPPVQNIIELRAFRVEGEINTDDLSPATEAWSRPDVPLHAQSMLENKIPNALSFINNFKNTNSNIAFVGDVVGTGSSRKSAINSVLWHFGKPVEFVPCKKQGGFVLGGKIAPIFFNTAQDSGLLPIECDVSAVKMGDLLRIDLQAGVLKNAEGDVLSNFNLKPSTILDEVRAGGRIYLMIGRALSDKARQVLGLEDKGIFIRPVAKSGQKKFTLAQKMVGMACGVPGVSANTYCEPKMTTVGSQDTTGAMTRDELKELACLGFSADLVMQSFCHTAAYPKPVDIALQHSLPDFITSRGGVSLRPGDGIIHSWLNRMLLPDTVGTGGDSHTRFPIGISFPAGSGLVAFAATSGVMPLEMPESVLVRFKGTMQPGITLRDLVNAIPYQAISQGLLTVEKSSKQNVFAGRILEIEGLENLRVEQAFELSDASAERSANGCTVRLGRDPIEEYLSSNIVLLKDMIHAGYGDAKTLARRIRKMQQWLDQPELLAPDAGCEYAYELEIDLDHIKEPLLACPNDPDDIQTLSQVAGRSIDEVFIGSCMTNIGHFRAAATLFKGMNNLPVRLWVVPPTRMDEAQLIEEGHYAVFGAVGARTETPGCSLCMGNQARTRDGATVMSTSTRNFPNRMGRDANVYLGSAELSAICAIHGKIPDVSTYLAEMKKLQNNDPQVYKYLNFNQLQSYIERANGVSLDALLKS